MTDTPPGDALSLDQPPLADCLRDIHEAQDRVEDAREAVQQARDVVRRRQQAFAETLQRTITALREHGTPGLPLSVAALVQEAYWDHPELRVTDLTVGTGLSGSDIRGIAGPRERQTPCRGCGDPTTWLQASRSDVGAGVRCAACEDELQRWLQPTPFRWDGEEDALYDHLAHRLAEVGGCNGSLRLTLRWAMREGLSEDAIRQWAQDGGGFCDCELLLNVLDPPGAAASW